MAMAVHNPKIYFLLSLLFFFSEPVISDRVNFLHQYCSGDGRYDEGSLYQNNLNILLQNFSSEAATKMFYNSTSGEGPNKVYGLFLCNGVYSSDVCQDCITVAAGQVQQRCPHDVEAIVWYERCMLRYANRSIFSLEDHSVYHNLTFGPVKYKQFEQQLSSILIDLTNKVLVDNLTLAFASGDVYVTDAVIVMAYVECTPDLTSSDCKLCLQTAQNRLPMDGRLLGAVVQPSCRLVFVFLDVASLVSGKGVGLSYIATIAMAVVAAASLIVIFYIFLRRKKARGKPTGMDEIESMENLHLDFKTIKAATDNFSHANEIGKGGFGVVYMGTLPDGQAIAVKRLMSTSGQGSKEFKSEACLAAKLQHKNLVKLFGFCLEGEEKLLIYEFVPNKSVDRYLFDKNRGVFLKWETRQRIITGIARGLLYLHEDSRFKIIHRDLKPSNILLDGEMNPKIADFGIAKLFEVDQTQGITSRVAGTFGYMAPEYASTGHFSVKSDVFSFGVILLQIVSGRRNSISDLGEPDGNLLNHAWRLWNEGASLKLVDPNLNETCSNAEVTRYIHIALLCIQEDPARRPTIAWVSSMLSYQSVTLPSPTAPPAFPYRRNISEALKESNALFAEDVFTDVHGR